MRDLYLKECSPSHPSTRGYCYVFIRWPRFGALDNSFLEPLKKQSQNIQSHSKLGSLLQNYDGFFQDNVQNIESNLEKGDSDGIKRSIKDLFSTMRGLIKENSRFIDEIKEKYKGVLTKPADLIRLLLIDKKISYDKAALAIRQYVELVETEAENLDDWMLAGVGEQLKTIENLGKNI